MSQTKEEPKEVETMPVEKILTNEKEVITKEAMATAAVLNIDDYDDDDEDDVSLTTSGEDDSRCSVEEVKVEDTKKNEAATPAPGAPAPKKQKFEPLPKKAEEKEEEIVEYELEGEPSAANDDGKIDTPALVLFGLHPLVREPSLRKLCETWGTVDTIGVRSAFASRYGHVIYSSISEAKAAYNAMNGAKLMSKSILVQPIAPDKTG
jgi:hypothetical protein